MWDIILYSNGSRMLQRGREVNQYVTEAIGFVVVDRLCFLLLFAKHKSIIFTIQKNNVTIIHPKRNQMFLSTDEMNTLCFMLYYLCSSFMHIFNVIHNILQ